MVSSAHSSPTCHQHYQTTHHVHRKSLNYALHKFRHYITEERALQTLRDQPDMYMLQKCVCSISNQQKDTSVILNIQDYMRVVRPTNPEKSNVVYLQVLDAKLESKDILMQVLHNFHQRFIVGQGKECLVLVADAKLYEVLQSLKFEYREELEWVLPFPNDWHLLMNYQKALIKPYFDACLKQLAHVAGYPVVAIQKCSQFKRTHHFFMEVWQAVYQVMVQRFLNSCNAKSDTSRHPETLLHTIQSALIQTKSNSDTELSTLLTRLHELTMHTNYHYKFSSFFDNMAATDPTWRLWVQFVFEDAMAYVGLFLAIRSGDWELHLACIKSMAPVFSAFDHLAYRKLIAQHLADVMSLPQSILECFHMGGFVVSLSGHLGTP